MRSAIATIVLILFFSVRGICNATDCRQIDLVFCIDLSGSTNGLIDDVRDNMWEIINQVNTYRPLPNLRLGVVAFSRPSFGKENGYVKILSPLTNNFEGVAFEMAKLKPSIEKGDQLVGMALKTATQGMDWTADANALKVIFLIGNGHVNLDGMKYKESYDFAVQKKIIVNTVYCQSPNYKNEIAGWREISRNTGGLLYTMMVHKRNLVSITTSETEKLHELGKQFFQTYLYYGKSGKEIYKMEELIDKTAIIASEMSYQSRLFYKMSELYQSKQNNWDLVDYLRATNSDFTELDYESLPDTLKKYSPPQLRKLIMAKKDERLRTLSQLRGLLKFDRQQVINKTVKEKGYDKNPDSLDRIVISWLNKAAAEKDVNTFVN